MCNKDQPFIFEKIWNKNEKVENKFKKSENCCRFRQNFVTYMYIIYLKTPQSHKSTYKLVLQNKNRICFVSGSPLGFNRHSYLSKFRLTATRCKDPNNHPLSCRCFHCDPHQLPRHPIILHIPRPDFTSTSDANIAAHGNVLVLDWYCLLLLLQLCLLILQVGSLISGYIF